MREEPLTYEERKGRNRVAAAGYRKVEQADRDRTRRELERLARIRALFTRWPGEINNTELISEIAAICSEGGQEDLRDA